MKSQNHPKKPSWIDEVLMKNRISEGAVVLALVGPHNNPTIPAETVAKVHLIWRSCGTSSAAVMHSFVDITVREVLLYVNLNY